MDAPGNPTPPILPAALQRRLQLASASLAWERLWPTLWPAVAVLGCFLALALFDLPARLPGYGQDALLLVFAGLLLAAGLHAARRFHPPGRAEARRRIETASGLSHRPLAAIEDRLSAGVQDPATAALWRLHQTRMAAAAKRLRVGVPAGGLVRRDPYALRVALALVLLLGFIDAGADWSDRLLRSLIPSIGPSSPAAVASLDIWVTPPDYTGLPPQFLPATAAETPVAVPTGSTLLAQVHGGGDVPRLSIDDHSSDFTAIDATNFKGAATLTAGRRLAVSQGYHTLGSWPIAVIPDHPPAIAFVRPPQHTDRGVLRLDYDATDDYGVEGVKATIRRPDDPAAPALSLDLPLPGQHLKEAKGASYHDLTANLWAGLPVEIELQATDALGQVGTSEHLRITLPERVFHNPVARALIEQRKELTLHPRDKEVVSETLGSLALQPALYNNDIVAFLAMRTAARRLLMDGDAQAVPAVQGLLWDTALRIEDGRATGDQRDLRQAMQSLQDALARNAPDAEIQRLMQEVQQAMDRYLQALAQQARRPDAQQNQPPVDPSRMLSQRDLQHMLDQARDLARTGNRDQAKQLLSQLQQMLENLRTARPMRGQNGQNQAMSQMQQMMRQQQQLLDRSFQRSRQSQNGQNGQQSQSDARQQQALRQMLDQMTRQLGQQGGQTPQALSQAERAMRGAEQALRQGQSDRAAGQQGQALDALQQAARAMAQQMLGDNDGNDPGGPPGAEDGMHQPQRDPFGRLTNEDRASGGVDNGGQLRMGKSNDTSLEKAKQILDELRRRAGQRERPEIERDYIDRLLKEF